MNKTIEFLTIDGLVLVGFHSVHGYTAIYSYENDNNHGIYPASMVVYENYITRPIFYKSGQQLN